MGHIIDRCITCSCRVRPDMGRARGGAASFATAHVQIRVKWQRKEGDGRRRGGFMKGEVFSESTVEELNHSFLLRYGRQ